MGGGVNKRITGDQSAKKKGFFVATHLQRMQTSQRKLTKKVSNLDVTTLWGALVIPKIGRVISSSSFKSESCLLAGAVQCSAVKAEEVDTSDRRRKKKRPKPAPTFRSAVNHCLLRCCCCSGYNLTRVTTTTLDDVRYVVVSKYLVLGNILTATTLNSAPTKVVVVYYRSSPATDDGR